MLGITPLVSMSERRLGLIINSSMERDSDRVVLEISTSRKVRPICSRSSRKRFPAASATSVLTIFRFPSKAYLPTLCEACSPDKDTNPFIQLKQSRFFEHPEALQM